MTPEQEALVMRLRAAGDIATGSPQAVILDALEYLVRNTPRSNRHISKMRAALKEIAGWQQTSPDARYMAGVAENALKEGLDRK